MRGPVGLKVNRPDRLEPESYTSLSRAIRGVLGP